MSHFKFANRFENVDFCVCEAHHVSLVQVKNLDQLFRRLALTNVEEKRQWHMVVDTSCLLQPDSLKVFRQLEGNKDIRVIIPKIGEAQ